MENKDIQYAVITILDAAVVYSIWLCVFVDVCLHRKLAKSTLLLVLVFGIHYIVFVGMPHTFEGQSWEVRMYCELFLNSFQVISKDVGHDEDAKSSVDRWGMAEEENKSILDFSSTFANIASP